MLKKERVIMFNLLLNYKLYSKYYEKTNFNFIDCFSLFNLQ